MLNNFHVKLRDDRFSEAAVFSVGHATALTSTNRAMQRAATRAHRRSTRRAHRTRPQNNREYNPGLSRPERVLHPRHRYQDEEVPECASNCSCPQGKNRRMEHNYRTLRWLTSVVAPLLGSNAPWYWYVPLEKQLWWLSYEHKAVNQVCIKASVRRCK